eukprot:4741096-Heterocapsa_arctica.AAC.1
MPADAPSIDKQRIHYLTHLPRAAWCVICALAASRAGAHLSADGGVLGPPKFQFDYCDVKSDGGYYPTEEGRPTQ